MTTVMVAAKTPTPTASLSETYTFDRMAETQRAATLPMQHRIGYKEAIHGPEGQRWLIACATEFDRLVDWDGSRSLGTARNP
jgi:hypothetical protein